MTAKLSLTNSWMKTWLHCLQARCTITHVLGQGNPGQVQHSEEFQFPHPSGLSTPCDGPIKATLHCHNRIATMIAVPFKQTKTWACCLESTTHTVCNTLWLWSATLDRQQLLEHSSPSLTPILSASFSFSSSPPPFRIWLFEMWLQWTGFPHKKVF